MGLFNGCLLASDADGTLINNGYINPRNIERIRFFINEGGQFSVASGRGAEGILPIVSKIGDISPSVVLNGGMIYDTTCGRILLQKSLDNTDKHFVAEVMARLPGVGIEVHSCGRTYVVKRTCETDDHEEYEEITPCYLQYREVEKLVWNKVIYLPKSMEELTVLEQITDAPCSCDFMHTTANINGRTRRYYEQLPCGVSKATALIELKELLHIENGGLFAIGDYYNDLEMLETADIGASTAESPEDIRNKSDYVSCGCNNGAVADFIDYLTRLKTKGCE